MEPQKVLVKNEGKTVHGSYGNEEMRPKETSWLTNGWLDLNPGLLGPTLSPFCSPGTWSGPPGRRREKVPGPVCQMTGDILQTQDSQRPI